MRPRYRPHSYRRSRRFLAIRYSLFIFRGLQLRALSFLRRQKLRGRVFRNIRRGLSLGPSRNLPLPRYALYLRFWWRRALLLGSAAPYRVGLRLNPLRSATGVSGVPSRVSLLGFNTGPVFFLYLLYASSSHFRHRTSVMPPARLLLKVLLTQRSGLRGVVGVLDPAVAPLSRRRVHTVGVPRRADRMYRNVFNMPDRRGRYPRCFRHYRNHIKAIRLGITRILP